MRRIYLGAHEATLSDKGLTVTSRDAKQAEVEVNFSIEVVHALFEFLYQFREELSKLRNQLPISQKTFEIVTPEQRVTKDQADDWIDWERHLRGPS